MKMKKLMERLKYFYNPKNKLTRILFILAYFDSIRQIIKCIYSTLKLLITSLFNKINVDIIDILLS